MKLLFVADGRSPIARNWISYFAAQGNQVHLVSTRRMPELEGLRSVSVVPVAFSGLANSFTGPGAGAGGQPAGSREPAMQAGGRRAAGADRPHRRGWWRSAATIGMRSFLRHWFGPLTVAGAGRRLRPIIDQLQPDLVHALRIPYEGAMAAAAGGRAPLIVSSWGNDFTLHAPASPLMGRMTRATLRRADALHADCRRDLRLASEWGFAQPRPSLVLPGNGGVRRELFHAGPPGESTDKTLASLMRSLPADAPLVINPRGYRAYVRNRTFFGAIPLILEHFPNAQFACPAMAGERRAERWVERLGAAGSIHLLPKLAPTDMAVLMRRAQVMVSPSEHDGTPNTLLESMACGAYPVLGRLESVAEWIEHGSNGALIDPRSPQQLAAAVTQALADPQLRARAAEINQAVIAERAEYSACMARAESFYRRVLAQ